MMPLETEIPGRVPDCGELVTTYHYNTKNQLMQETSKERNQEYNYDHRGNLLSVTSGERGLKMPLNLMRRTG